LAHSRDRRWWREDEGSEHGTLCKLAEELSEKLSSRHEADRRHMRLYGGAQYAGLSPRDYNRELPASERVAWNVIASVIDTYVAKMLKATPAPMFLTNGADWDVRRKAEKLNRFGKGVLHAADVYRHGPTIERDAAIFGTSPLFIYSEGKKIRSERVFPWEILVDDVEAFYGSPRQLIRQKYVDRQVLRECFAGDEKAQKAIDDAPEADRSAIGRDTTADQVCVREGWRLPSGEDASDGRHVIAIETATLRSEEWDRPRFPFAIRRWADPIAGFWGVGIAERLTGIQLEINKLLLRIQQAHHLLGRPIVVLDATSGIPETHLTNEVAAVLVSNHPGDPITVHAPPTMPADVYQHLMTLRTQAFEEIGVSMLEAAARKPAGLDSAPSLREYNDIGSERFMLQGKRREEWHLDCVRLSLDEARGIDGFTVDVPDKNATEPVSWADVSLEDSAYHLQCFPTSMLPQTPAGRTEAIQELAKVGVPQDETFELLDLPDLDEWKQIRLAARNAVRARVSAILDGEPYETPEAFDSLEAVLALGQPMYLIARTQGAPESVLSQLRRYINDAVRLKSEAEKAAAKAAAPPAAMDPMSAMGAPAPAAPMPPTDPLAGIAPMGNA
jgi:hypothetical protein